MTYGPVTVELTKNPKPKTPADQLGFGRVFSDHMFLMDWTDEKGWHNPRVVPYGPLAMDPAAAVLHYGQSVFEGLKAYKKDGKVTLFRPQKNFARLNQSADRLALPQLDEKFALEALKTLLNVELDWVPDAENTSMYVRPVMFATDASMGVHPGHHVTYAVVLSPSGLYFKGLNPVSIFVETQFVRAAVGGVGYAKTAGNYAASYRGQERAEKFGCAQCLWTDANEHKYVEEVGAMNIFFKMNGKFYTPALTGSILPGVTRDSMLQLLKDFGQEVVETRLTVDELFEKARTGELEEVFGTGTAAVVTPVGKLVRVKPGTQDELEEVTVNNNQTGEWTQRLYDELTGIQLGTKEDKHGWVVHVN